jgi:hypothetical protein
MSLALFKGPNRVAVALTSSENGKSLNNIWGFRGGEYNECRLLGNKNPVHTSQEAHYFSTTESSQLMLCKIWGFHGGDYEECRLLGCDDVWLFSETMFRRNVDSYKNHTA